MDETFDQENGTAGIEPEWWASAIARGPFANDAVAYYCSGQMDIRVVQGFVMFDIEPDDRVDLLAVTTTTLVGAEVRRNGNGTRVWVSRSAIPLREVRRIDSSWPHWIDPERLDSVDMSPGDGLTVQIELRSALGGFGEQIGLPLRKDDYRGEPSPAVCRFVEALERLSYKQR
jgi:hypothetical protein